MSSWQTCAPRPTLQLWVQTCKSQTLRRVLYEDIVARGFRGMPVPILPPWRQRSLQEGRCFDQGALKKVWYLCWTASPEMRRHSLLARHRHWPHCLTPSSSRKVLVKKAALIFTSNNPVQPLSYPITKDFLHLLKFICPVSLSSSRAIW